MTSGLDTTTRARHRLRRNPLLAVGLALALVAGVVGINSIAGADTTIDPSGPGAIGADTLVRDSTVDVEVAPGGMAFKKANAAGSYGYLPLGLASVFDLAGCAGDNSAVADGASGNRSPWTKVNVSGPGGFSYDWYSPAVQALNLAAPFPPSDPQPAPNSTSAYRGQTPPTQGGSGFTIPVELEESGVYTVTTTIKNMVKTGFGACAVGTPVAGASAGTFTSGVYPAGSELPTGGVVQPGGLVVETHTFEYRPWQQVFTDIAGEGKVSFNITPAESQVQVGKAPNTVTGAILPGGMQFYAAPGLGAFALPADPQACATDPASCLPSSAVPCDPAAGCVPRLVIIEQHGGTPFQDLIGVFDLETRAFIAYAKVGNTGRLLFSLGNELDPIYAGLIPQLRAAAAAAGMDIEDLLGLGVSISEGPPGAETTFTLLNGLQINPATNPAGIHLLLNDIGAQAGLLLNVYSAITPIPDGAPADYCTASGSAASGEGYQRTAPVGYKVQKSDVLIDVPSAAGLDALGVGGKIWHIAGDFRRATPLVNLSGALAGAEASTSVPLTDSDLLEVHYLLDAGAALADTRVPRTMDFVGTANWSASETRIPLVGCLTIDFMLGVGVNLLNNPLPVGFGSLPIWNPNPGAASLIATLNLLIADATAQVTGNPVVQDVLDQVIAATGLQAILDDAIPG